MSKRDRDLIIKEIADLAALADDAIDTSEISEIRDWSDALKGRFHRLTNPSITVLLRDTAGERLRSSITAKFRDISEAWKQSRLQSDHSLTQKPFKRRISDSFRTWLADLAELLPEKASQTIQQEQPSKSSEIWSEQSQEIFRRLHPLITRTVVMIARQRNSFSTELIDDFIQEIYVRLFAALKAERIPNEKIPGLITMLAESIVPNRLQAAQRGTHVFGSQLSQESAKTSQNEQTERDLVRNAILDELQAKLSSRERVVLKLYLQGFTPKEISESQEINLSEEAVRILLHRMSTMARSKSGMQLALNHKSIAKTDL
jgi:RNA polymerase sigma factor (sigma-70 family)